MALQTIAFALACLVCAGHERQGYPSLERALRSHLVQILKQLQRLGNAPRLDAFVELKRSSLALYVGTRSRLGSLSMLLLTSELAASFNPHVCSIGVPFFASARAVAFGGHISLSRSLAAMSSDKHLLDILGDFGGEEPSSSLESLDSPPPEDDYIVQLRKDILKWLDSSLEGEKRKRASLEKEAEAALDAERLGHWAKLIVANLHKINDRTESVVVEDWEQDCAEIELQFDLTAGTPREQADKAFAKARRLRRGSSVVADLIETSGKCEIQIEAWKNILSSDEADVKALRKDILKSAGKFKLKTHAIDLPKKAIAAKLPSLPVVTSLDLGPPEHGIPGGLRLRSKKHSQHKWEGRVFTSPHGVPILVGRNKKENDLLSVQVARDPDVWFHVRDMPGAHVVLQMSRVAEKVEPSDMCMQMAADLAAFYSDARDDNKARVSFTTPKHVIKRKGMPTGAVQIRNEQGTLIGRPTDSIYIPDEIVEQRDRERFG